MTGRQIKLSSTACGNENGLTTLEKFVRLFRHASVHSRECACVHAIDKKKYMVPKDACNFIFNIRSIETTNYSPANEWKANQYICIME